MDSLSPRTDLAELAKQWGAISIEKKPIDSDAMLVRADEGYRIILNDAKTRAEVVRQRFSLAHELAHLLLHREGFGDYSNAIRKHRKRDRLDEEERLCNQIAAEILMPCTAFSTDASQVGWSLEGLRSLSRRYDTSVQATASRLVSLAPETCHMTIWKLATSDSEGHKLQHSFGKTARYGIQNSNKIPRRRLWLISRAARSPVVEYGISPLSDRARPTTFPKDVPAEAWAWGKDEFQRVLVFYFPERGLSDDMLAVANATWRAF